MDENLRLRSGINDRDVRIQNQSLEIRELSDKLSSMSGQVRALTDAIKESSEDKSKLFDHSEKQRTTIGKKNELLNKLNDEAIENEKRIKTYREREEDQAKKILSIEKELEDARNQMNKLQKAAETSVEVSNQAINAQEIMRAENEARKKRESYCTDQNCFDEKKCGRNHSKKSLQKFPCRFFIKGN